MNPVRFGILGAARITPAALVYPAETVSGVRLDCVAARDPARARAFAAEHAIPTVLDDYAAVVAADVEAIYNPLPISLHAPWTIAALEAGKHVLCEKPLTLNAAEAQRVRAAARASGRVLMEAFHYRHHPVFQRLLTLLDEGRIGTLQRIEALFTVRQIPADDIRMQLALGGGALMDIGCYPAHWIRHVCGREPAVVSARADTGPAGVDLVTEAELDCGQGVSAGLRCGMGDGVELAARLRLTGDAGELVLINPVAPQAGHELRLIRPDGDLREQVDRTPSYVYQLEAFRDAVVDGTTIPTDADDAVANMALIDAIYVAAGLSPRG